MSRIAKLPINIPDDINVEINGQTITIKGKNNKLTRTFNKAVHISYLKNIFIIKPYKGYTDGWAQAGTARAILNSMIIGVTTGFSKKLQLVGVGYRVAIKNEILNLSLGFSHQIEYKLPSGIIAECPSQTEIIIKGADKEIVGQIAANIRAYRPPESYKGKGIRYVDEVIHTKNTKKK